MKPWAYLLDDKWGFELQNSLNPKMWTSRNKLQPSIRSTLLEIVEDFLDDDRSLIDIKDITVTGSLANYNWSTYSDIDLHIIADFGSGKELKKKILDYKRKIWNTQHEIKVEGFDVEVYVEEYGEPHYSSGVYSVLSNKWLVHPKLEAKAFDIKEVERKANCLADGIDHIEELIDDSSFKQAISSADGLMVKIKKQRNAGLASGGEYSVENLAFKLLRRRGDIKRLLGLKDKAYDCSKSINKKDCI